MVMNGPVHLILQLLRDNIWRGNSMVKKIIFFSIFIFLICFDVFPKSKKSKVKYPNWINEPYTQFDRNDFFVAVGNDKNKSTAELKAVEELASIFGRDVKTNTIAESSISRIEQNHISTIVEEQNLNQQILVNVDQRNLIGIEIKESFLDEKKDTWYVLAILDKHKASLIYEKEIENGYKTIIESYNAAKNTSKPFDKLGYIFNCKQIAQYTQSLISRLQIIDYNKASELKREDLTENKFSIEFNSIANTVPISIEIQGDYNNEIKVACTKVFESLGFKITQISDYVLNIKVDNSYRNVTKPDAVYCESILSIQLNSKDGNILFPFNYSSRAGAKNEELALKKEYELLSSVIQSDYKQAIQNILLQE